jgi:hypothetical protein
LKQHILRRSYGCKDILDGLGFLLFALLKTTLQTVRVESFALSLVLLPMLRFNRAFDIAVLNSDRATWHRLQRSSFISAEVAARSCAVHEGRLQRIITLSRKNPLNVSSSATGTKSREPQFYTAAICTERIKYGAAVI